MDLKWLAILFIACSFVSGALGLAVAGLDNLQLAAGIGFAALVILMMVVAAVGKALGGGVMNT